MSDPTMIKNPWIIVHQPGGEGGSMITLLLGPSDCRHSHFGLAIADIIRHVARRFDITDEEVMDWVEREMAHPTTKIKGGTLQ